MSSEALFVVVEGPEGAGKSTLVANLVRRAEAAGLDVLAVREPGGTPEAEEARALVLDPDRTWEPAAELFLILAARAELVANVIRPKLEAGSGLVISDRFDLSTWAYQVAGRGLPGPEVDAANRLATGGLTPGLTLVLDLSAEEGRQRQAVQGKTPDRMERADPAMHERVSEAFRDASGPGLVHLDGGLPPDALADLAWSAIEARLPGTPPS